MEWEKLTAQQQQALTEILQETAQDIRDQFGDEVTKLQQHAAQGRMLARRDGAGITQQPIPPVPDVKRDSAFEKLALDTHRMATYLAYLKAAQAHLSSRGFDIGVGLSEYLAYRTDSLPEGWVKTMAKVMEQAASASYTALYTHAVNVFPQLSMQRLMEWDEQSRQQESLFERLRRMLG
jgi:hypothetical protein